MLAVVTLLLVALGVAVCYAAGTYRDDWNREATQQLSGALIGGIAFLVVARLDYQIWRKLARPMFLATLAGLAAIAVVALIWRSSSAPGMLEVIFPRINGSRRWVKLFGLQVQLSEIARFTLPVMIAAIAAGVGNKIRDLSRGFWPMVRPVAIVAPLVFVQPNVSMFTLLSVGGLAVAFVAGARMSHLALIFLPAGALLAGVLALSPERADRLASFLTPALECRSGDQVCDSLIGLGNGGVVGVGFGEGTQKLGHLPYGYSDFILSVIGEEWGFVGVVFLVICFVVFCSMGFRIARTAPDTFGTALAGGVTVMTGAAALMHAAVVMSLMPATGLPLPFLSAGRVSLIISLLSTGVLVSIGQRRGKPARRR